MSKLYNINVILLGVSSFDGMASSNRVRNLLEPLVENDFIRMSNLIYKKDTYNLKLQKAGMLNKVNYKVIDFSIGSIFSKINYVLEGIKFIYTNKRKNFKNIIYNYQYPDIRTVWFILFAKIIGYKIILDIVEDHNHIYNFPNRSNRIRMKSSNFLIKLSPYFTNGIIAISHELYNKMSTISKGRIPVFLVPISVNLDNFNLSEDINNSSELNLFYGGSFAEKDGVSLLINVFDKIADKYNNVKLLLTGRASENDEKKLTAALNNAKNGSQIVYNGFLENREYYELVRSSDIFCVTRINSKFANSGFPFKLGEFLATGKPVICTDVGSINKYLKNELNAIIISADSDKELYDAIEYLVLQPDIRKRIGLEGRKTAEHFFDTKIHSNKVLEIFYQL